MNEKLITFCASAGAVGSALASFLGGWDVPLQALLVFMAVDFVMGLACAVFFGKSKKSKNGGLSSAACWKGICKKIGTLLLVVCSVYADKLIGIDYMRNAVVIAFCVSELVSIIEIAAIMGIMPESVQRVFEKIIDILKGDGKNGKN